MFVLKRFALPFKRLHQVVARHIFHHQELAFVFKKMIAYARQCRMLEAVQKACLAFERFAETIVHAKRFFDRDRAVKTFIVRQINGTHSALPDQFIDAVTLL